jgi:hypothetical protein
MRRRRFLAGKALSGQPQQKVVAQVLRFPDRKPASAGSLRDLCGSVVKMLLLAAAARNARVRR